MGSPEMSAKASSALIQVDNGALRGLAQIEAFSLSGSDIAMHRRNRLSCSISRSHKPSGIHASEKRVLVFRKMTRYTTKFSQAKPNFSQPNSNKTKENGLDFFGFLWISLDSFVRFRAFQRITSDAEQNNFCRLDEHDLFCLTEHGLREAQGHNASCLPPPPMPASPTMAVKARRQNQFNTEFLKYLEQK